MTQPKDSDPALGAQPPTGTPEQVANALDAAATGLDQLAVAFGDRTALAPPANAVHQLSHAAAVCRQSAAIHRGAVPGAPEPVREPQTVTAADVGPVPAALSDASAIPPPPAPAAGPAGTAPATGGKRK